ncbi:hypothetical protein [uncultured Cohaesibacter sp.]|uniref:hypothetical protein n=1 Tax=uncultured Cohaesibacter sp. TaxID=1002546 RepID=UPI0029312739|nr:hypothetical protein [uncultured Cohaesibacter sp.]
MSEKPWQQINTLLNRARLLCEDREEAALLRYIIDQACDELENLKTQITIERKDPFLFH